MIFFLLVICSGVSVTLTCETETPIIGVVAMELGLSEEFSAYTTYIAASYVKATESSGARVVPIVPNKKESYYRKLLNSINGVVLPGGDGLIGKGHPYYDTVRQIYKIVKEINDAGKPFPILGVCLGFEFLLTIANNDKSFLMNCSTLRENLPLKFTVPYNETNFFSTLTEKQYNTLSKFNATVNQHTWCARQDDFLNSSLTDWITTTTSTNAAGIEFIASVEHKKYPFFGVQFHPEKIAFEWAASHNYPHCGHILIANRYFYDKLVYFAKQNTNKFDSSKAEKKALIYNYPAKVPDTGYFQQYYLF